MLYLAFFLAFYLASTLAFFLTFFLAFFLASILTFYLVSIRARACPARSESHLKLAIGLVSMRAQIELEFAISFWSHPGPLVPTVTTTTERPSSGKW